MSGANLPFLVVPATAPERGTGHLKRSASLVRRLRELGGSAFMYLEGGFPGSGSDRPASELLEKFPSDLDPGLLFRGAPAASAWACVVLDRFRTSRDEFVFWSGVAPLVGVDEGGPERTRFDYLIDLLPGLPARAEANMADAGFLDLPRTRRAAFSAAPKGGRPKVLVTFGGEDPAGLTLPAVRALSEAGSFEIVAVLGALVPPGGEAGLEALGATVLRAVPDLKETFASYDAVVTQFGLAAFEAAWARVPVVLMSPTPYHGRLARSAGFASAGTGPAAAKRLPGLLGDPSRLARATEAAAPRESRDLAAFLLGFDFKVRCACPVCGRRADGRALARFPDRTYRRCGSCRAAFMTRPADPPVEYARAYFFEDYKKQYGKTYLEDFPHLEAMARARMRRISDLADRRREGGPPRVLDVGCAYGPFLAAARGGGWQPFGLDPARDAVRFVQEELGIRAEAGSFPGFDVLSAFAGDGGDPRFDALTMWYVIEHFVDVGAVLEAANRALLPGGVLAFSTPSFSGVSSLADRRLFLERSPADHWTIWEPGLAASLLRRHGFELAQIVVTGHHPERFPPPFRPAREGAGWKAALAASRAFGLGDTFEAYAVKREGSRGRGRGGAVPS